MGPRGTGKLKERLFLVGAVLFFLMASLLLAAHLCIPALSLC